MDSKIISLAIFLTAYLLFIIFPKKRVFFSIFAVALLILVGIISPKEAFLSVNWNVMAIFVGTLIVADLFTKSKVPAHAAEIIIKKAKNTAWAILFICLLTGFISAFVENVATVLIVAPIALSLSKKMKMNPVKMMIAIAISSNLQGTATLIGDPPSMLLGSFAKMNFGDFFLYQGKPSIFFAVELGAVFSFIILYFIFRNHKEKIPSSPVEKVKSWLPTIILASLIFALAICSFCFDYQYSTGIICILFGIISLIVGEFISKNFILESLKLFDWETVFFLIGVFILVGSITSTGWIETASAFLTGLMGKNIFLGYTLIVFISVFLSAFIDNVPFLIAMLPVAASTANQLQINPALFLFGLLIGTSLGGNITPIGASANIVALSLLKKEGYKVGFCEFLKIGLPFTLAAVTAAYFFIWFVWAR
ncbi:MAG: SLC13 family permease [Candidatus Pacebacteria bacterium]|nr:SLC13 family permease [Candidatus Paceibacterota bacterium]